eukprot:jgi/Astpho2/1301/fgenesh1_pg.00024_%23_11_t
MVLQDWDTALQQDPACTLALVQKGRLLCVFKKGQYEQDAKGLWELAVATAKPCTDVGLLIEASNLIQHPSMALAQQCTASGALPAGDSSQHLKAATAANGVSQGSTQRPPTSAGQAVSRLQSPAAKRAAAQKMGLTAPAVGVAVLHINAGRLDAAMQMLDDIIEHAQGPDVSAHVARGTARAMSNQLAEAVEDFSVACQLMPEYGDAWKRRGQARSALGENEGALEAAKVLNNNAQVWNMLGRCQVSSGDVTDGIRSYQRSLRIQDSSREAWFNLAQANKEIGNLAEAEAAFSRGLHLGSSDRQAVQALRVLAHMKQGCGEHSEAVKVLTRALDVGVRDQMVQCHFLRGACYHALGYHARAVQDYQRAFTAPANPDAPEEEHSQQFLSFYQKEHALWMHSRLDTSIQEFCLDKDLLPSFKENWCKKGPPNQELLSQYRPQPPIQSDEPAVPPADPQKVARLCAFGHSVGKLLQYRHQGFLPNKRQQLSGGLAALELAQTLRNVVGLCMTPEHMTVSMSVSSFVGIDESCDEEMCAMWAGGKPYLPLACQVKRQRAGAQAAVATAEVKDRQQRGPGAKTAVQTAGASVGGWDAKPPTTSAGGFHEFCWRDAMDVVVRWRQLSEPNDQAVKLCLLTKVVWVDLLTKKEFEAGFGSHTPIFCGQTKCVRYYMNFERAMAVVKQCLDRDGRAFDQHNNPVPLAGDHKRAEIQSVKTAEDLWKAIGRDSWIVVPIDSTARPGHTMEGTRLTIVKFPKQPHAYEFSIRTPVTPSRWAEFDQEFTLLFTQLMDAMVEGDKPAIAHAALTFIFYWYNFMPLARGTAAVGYITLLGIFLAAGMPITAPIPQGCQVDWEAILSPNPAAFIASVSPWLYPAAAREPVQPPSGTGGLQAASAKLDSGIAEAQPPSGSGAQEQQQPAGNRASTLPGRAVPTSASGRTDPQQGAGKAVEQKDVVATLPSVARVLDTMRKRLEALNGPGAERI